MGKFKTEEDRQKKIASETPRQRTIRVSGAKAYLRLKTEGLCVRCHTAAPTAGLTCCVKCTVRSRNLLSKSHPYRHVSGPCVRCGFEFSDVHHKDGNHDNNDPNNLTSLCPNHHRLAHMGLLAS